VAFGYKSTKSTALTAPHWSCFWLILSSNFFDD
jgi:hypothetical protein